jgi:hypothetical protein
MNPALRPMSLGEILDRTFQVYRARFWVFIAIGVTPAAIMLLLHMGDLYWWHLAGLVRPFKQPGTAIWSFTVSLGYYHVTVLVNAIFSAGAIHAASKTVFNEPCSARTSLRFAFERWRSFLWIGVLILAIVLVGSEAIAGGLLAGLSSLMDAMGLLNDSNNLAIAFVLLVPSVTGFALFFWLTGCCAFLLPTCAVESLRGRKALRRSWSLSREARWKIVATFLLVMLLAFAVGLGVETAWRWLAVLIWRAWPFGHHFLSAIYRPTGYVLGTLLAVLIRPLYPIAATLFYYDQRIRKEGFDIEHMMQSAGLIPYAAVALAAEGSGESESSLAAAEELGA